MKIIQLEWLPRCRAFSLAIFCLVPCISAFSQSKQIEFQGGFLGLKRYYGGFNSSSFYYSQQTNLYFKNGYMYNESHNHDAEITPFTFQLFFRQTFSERWILTTGLSYMHDSYGHRHGIKYGRNDSTATRDIYLRDTYKYLNVPLQISYSFTDRMIRPYAGVGIYVGYVLSAKRTTTIKSSIGPLSEELDEMYQWGNLPTHDYEEKLSSGRLMLGLNAHIGLCFQLNKRIGITLPEIGIVQDLLRSANLYKEGDVGIPLGKWNFIEPFGRLTFLFGIRYSIN